jgi:inhibitor of cysteine peptidase
MKNVSCLLFIAFFWIELFCCSGINNSQRENQKGRPMLVITRDDVNKEFSLREGETFQIILRENPTTGYMWNVHQADPLHLKLESENYSAPEEDSLAVGKGGKKTLTFKVLKAGTVELILWLRRPWEDPSKFSDSFRVRLRISSP